MWQGGRVAGDNRHDRRGGHCSPSAATMMNMNGMAASGNALLGLALRCSTAWLGVPLESIDSYALHTEP